MPRARLFLKGWFDLGPGPCVEFSRVVGSARSVSLCLIACHRFSFNFESLSACIACLCLVRSFRYLQLSATDVSARTTMKGAAKCDKHCDLQNSVNQQGFERILRFRDTPESMPASVSSSVSCFWWILRPQGLESVCQLPVSVHQGASALDAFSSFSCCR